MLRISWDAYHEAEDLIPQAKSRGGNMTGILSEYVPIVSTSAPRTKTSPRETTFAYQENG
jgi:hypothetical protein